jgi:hypothetical protein
MAEAPEPARVPAPEPAPAAPPAPAAGPPVDETTPPMLPSRWAYVLAFAGVVFAGILGAIIGFGIADVSSHSDIAHVVGMVIGALIGAGGVGIVAVLVLRAMAEWRRHGPPDRSNRRPS